MFPISISILHDIRCHSRPDSGLKVFGGVRDHIWKFFFLWWWIEGEGCIHIILFHVLNPVPVSADETANPKSTCTHIGEKCVAASCGIS